MSKFLEIIKQTGVTLKTSGDRLTSEDINQINATINHSVEVLNSYLKSFFNINVEGGDLTKVYTLNTVVANVPVERRAPGMCVKFLDATKRFVSYVYSGSSVEDEEWKLISNWKPLISSYDGGEW